MLTALFCSLVWKFLCVGVSIHCAHYTREACLGVRGFGARHVVFGLWANCISKLCQIVLAGKQLNRKRRFLYCLVLVIFIYGLLLVELAVARVFVWLLVVSAAFVFSVYMVYRVTIRNVKLKYPIVSPEGHPDVYTGRMPRPVYEDMERYPRFFKKKRKKKLDNKKQKKN